jgi:DNA-binding MarR family transcriptional regulator
MRSLDEIGASLFGRRLRLRVALWVLAREERESFYQSQVADGVAYSVSGVVAELDRLVDLGMIRRLRPEHGDRRVYYVRMVSPLWEIIRAAHTAVELEQRGDASTNGGERATDKSRSALTESLE